MNSATAPLAEPAPTDGDAQTVARELASKLAARELMSVSTSMLGYGLQALLLSHSVAWRPLLAWVTAVLALEMVNGVVAWQLRHSLDDTPRRQRWLRRLPLTLYPAGAAWGGAAWLLDVSNPGPLPMVNLMVLAVVAIISVHNLCYHWPSLFAFNLGLVSAVMVSGAMQPTPLHLGLALAACALLVMVMIYGQASRALFVTDVRSRLLAEDMSRRLHTKNDELSAALQHIQELARLDPLTRALNRRAAMEMLAAEQRRTQRYGGHIGLVLMDLDHFKSVNDTHGHGVGDAVLVATADRLRATLRASDQLVRWGGEEFLCIVPQATTDGLATLAEALRRALCTKPLLTQPVTLHVSASIGTALLAGDGHQAAAIEAADQALYRAKHAGRNQVCAAVQDTCLSAVA